MVGWLSFSRARWLLWWGDRGMWWTPLGDPQKAASPPSPACHSPLLCPAVTPCGRAVVNCGCWLVKRHIRGSRTHIHVGEVPFTIITTGGGDSATLSYERGNSPTWRGYTLGDLFLSLLHGQHFFTGSMRDVVCA